MKKRTKKAVAVISVCAAMASAIPASAASSSFYGYTINYSNSKLSNTRAQAVTSCTGANSVTAKVTALYNQGSSGKSKSATTSSRVATVAVVDVGSGGYITSVSGYHTASVTSQGINRAWSAYS